MKIDQHALPDKRMTKSSFRHHNLTTTKMEKEFKEIACEESMIMVLRICPN